MQDTEEHSKTLENNIWYIDSGCSRHMTGCKKFLSKFKEAPGPSVTFGDNSRGITVGTGTMYQGNIEIHDISYVKGLKHNLLSISQFCDRGYNVEFTSNMCLIRDIRTNWIMLTGIRQKNIYVAD